MYCNHNHASTVVRKLSFRWTVIKLEYPWSQFHSASKNSGVIYETQGPYVFQRCYS